LFRMHLIALVLAHPSREIKPDLGDLLFRGSERAITEQTLTFYPNAIERVLRKLPPHVLTTESYRQLVELLGDNNAVEFFHHAEFVDDATITSLHGLPSPLRNSCIVTALDVLDLGNSFTDGLRLLVSRGAATNFDTLVAELASISDPERLFSTFKNLVETLPLPVAFPPPCIAGARRIDDSTEIRSRTKGWSVFESYLRKINKGTLALYAWEDGNSVALCLLERFGRLGWFLRHIRDPGEVDMDAEHLDRIHSAFAEAGFPRYAIVAAIYLMSAQAD
jgi:hypothetical protein